MASFFTYFRRRFFPNFVEYNAKSPWLFRFRHQEDLKRWTLTTDSNSNATFDLAKGGEFNHFVAHGVFKGILASKSNSVALPFCLIKIQPEINYLFFKEMIDVSEYAGLSIRLKGDGRVYIVNVQTFDFLGSLDLYQTKITTVPDIWKIYDIPFARLQKVRQGSNPVTKCIPADRIATIGLSIADGIHGNFSLSIEWIRASYKGEMRSRRHSFSNAS